MQKTEDLYTIPVDPLARRLPHILEALQENPTNFYDLINAVDLEPYALLEALRILEELHLIAWEYLPWKEGQLVKTYSLTPQGQHVAKIWLYFKKLMLKGV